VSLKPGPAYINFDTEEGGKATRRAVVGGGAKPHLTHSEAKRVEAAAAASAPSVPKFMLAGIVAGSATHGLVCEK